MVMTVRTALYTTGTDFGQLFPGEHQAASFLLTPQPATCSTDKRGRNIKCGCKVVLREYWQGSS